MPELQHFLSEEALPCIRCNSPLEKASNSAESENLPYAGTIFQSQGNFGSTVFDSPETSKYLELNVCDNCLRILAREGKILLVEHHVTKTIQSWEI